MKYFSRKIKINGEVFDSHKEYTRYQQLRLMQDKGIISELKRQVRYEILPAIYRTEEKQLKTKVKLVERCDERAKFYTADFCYVKDGIHIVEDVKSKATSQVRDYPLRRHLMKLLLAKMSEQEGVRWHFKETI